MISQDPIQIFGRGNNNERKSVQFTCSEVVPSDNKLPDIFVVDYYRRRSTIFIRLSDDQFQEIRQVDFNWTLFFVNLFATIYKFASIVLYLILAKLFWLEGNVDWFMMTLLFVLIPLVLTDALSFYWYWHDDVACASIIHHGVRPPVSKKSWTMRILSHLLLLGVEYRTAYFMYYGVKVMKIQERKRTVSDSGSDIDTRPITRRSIQSRRMSQVTTTVMEQAPSNDDIEMLYMCEDRDVSMLQALDGVLQDASEIVLQCYIMISEPDWFNVMNATVTTQLVTTILSIVFTALTLCCYTRATRLSVPNEHIVTNCALLLQFLWRTGTLTARLFAFSLIAATSPLIFILEILVHYVIMVTWLILQHTAFCDESKQHECGEWVFDLLLGLLYLFCFVNVKDEPTRLKYIFYYGICFLEDGFNVFFWYFRDDNHFSSMVHNVAVAGVLLCFAIGILFMILYYMYYHPHRPLPEAGVKPRLC